MKKRLAKKIESGKRAKKRIPVWRMGTLKKAYAKLYRGMGRFLFTTKLTTWEIFHTAYVPDRARPDVIRRFLEHKKHLTTITIRRVPL